LKLLLDQNLSYKLVAKLERAFLGTTQARLLGMAQATDTAIWQYAADNSFTIVTKDSDFYERSLIYGFPPKVIWLQCATPLPNSSAIYCLPMRPLSRPSFKTRIAPVSNSISKARLFFC